MFSVSVNSLNRTFSSIFLHSLQLVGAADFAAADDAGHTACLNFARGVLLLLQVGDPLGDLPSTWAEIVATLDDPVAPPDPETGRARMTRLLPPAVLLVQGWMAGVGWRRSRRQRRRRSHSAAACCKADPRHRHQRLHPPRRLQREESAPRRRRHTTSHASPSRPDSPRPQPPTTRRLTLSW